MSSARPGIIPDRGGASDYSVNTLSLISLVDVYMILFFLDTQDKPTLVLISVPKPLSAIIKYRLVIWIYTAHYSPAQQCVW